MKNDWSLKKEMVVWDTFAVYADSGDIIHFYKPSTIETLRKKLIEDVKHYFCGFVIDEQVVIDIINRRFGNK